MIRGKRLKSSEPVLNHPPTESELARLYYELARHGAPSLGRKASWPYRPRSLEALLTLSGSMLRYDARLLSVLVQWFMREWRQVHPIRLREWMHRMRYPQALAVVLDFARLAASDAELRYLVDYLSAGWPRVSPAERFFIDASRPASRRAEHQARRNLKPYARWGFLGTERPTVDPVRKWTVGTYDALTRRQILTDLLRRRSEITLADYLDALDHSISRQQARLDLAHHPDLAPSRRGPNAPWRSKGVTNQLSRTNQSNPDLNPGAGKHGAP